ncbi:MAG: hypothetical protein C0620_06405 [Desulfuromonas sp.]|nr:MAG: hypothetical protein C0620_06405 [Desulfuromonas sp.]
MNVTTATSAQNVSSTYNRQQKTSTDLTATTATQGDTVTISDEAKAIEQASQSLEAYRLPDWYADMLPLARTIDLSQQQIGAPYRETQAYTFSQLSQEDQQSINDYSGKLLTFFHDEVARLTEDGSADYVQIRDSEALQQAVMARFESDPAANALLERMQELGQIT